MPNRQGNLIANGLKGLMKAMIRGYQLVLSPSLPSSCRFHPNCSAYSMEAIEKFGPVKGLGLTIWRILRCNPWNQGGLDPVPEHRSHTCGNDHVPHSH